MTQEHNTTIDDMKNILRLGVVEVVFTKKTTGEQRTMRVTLDEELLPERPASSKPPHLDPESTVIRAFEVDLQEWRSFDFESVIDYTLLIDA